jgi:hypothetical protein
MLLPFTSCARGSHFARRGCSGHLGEELAYTFACDAVPLCDLFKSVTCLSTLDHCSQASVMSQRRLHTAVRACLTADDN